MFTADAARAAAFYREVFGAEIGPGQPSVIRIGGVTLHVFEREGISADWSPVRLHHLAFEASDVPEFVAIRDVLLARGACSEEVVDFGEHVSLMATDPDGGMLEVLVANDGALPFPVVSR